MAFNFRKILSGLGRAAAVVVPAVLKGPKGTAIGLGAGVIGEITADSPEDKQAQRENDKLALEIKRMEAETALLKARTEYAKASSLATQQTVKE